MSVTRGSVAWITDFTAPTVYKHRVHTEDNEAGCYHVTGAQIMAT